MSMSRLRYGLLIIVLALLPLRGLADSGPSSVSYCVRWVSHTCVHVITVDLNDDTLAVVPKLYHDTPGERQSFIRFLTEYHPIAQLTGSYFSLSNALPIGDIVTDGTLVYRGPVGSALAIKSDNSAEIVNVPYGWKYSWPGYENVLKGGLRLLQRGKYAVYPRDQGFRDPSLFRHASRTAVGLTAGNKLLLVATSKGILLSELARIMKALGCRDAMTLDGGASTGMAFGSNVILMPGRTLSNVLMVVQRPAHPDIDTQAAASSRHAFLAGNKRADWSYLLSSLVNPRQFRYSNVLMDPPDTALPAETWRRKKMPLLSAGLAMGW